MTEPPPASWYRPHPKVARPKREHAAADYPVYVTTFRKPDGSYSEHYREARRAGVSPVRSPPPHAPAGR